ncbi:MAG: hypothetical protein AAF797_00880 [Planctomycetota bacterium]
MACEPGLTLRELRGRLSVPVALSTVSRALDRLGLTLKKQSLIASEQRRPDVVERRMNSGIARRFIDPASLVFLDGSEGTEQHDPALRPIATPPEEGQRRTDHTPRSGGSHWKTATLISAIRVNGVVR